MKQLKSRFDVVAIGLMMWMASGSTCRAGILEVVACYCLTVTDLPSPIIFFPPDAYGYILFPVA